MRHENDSADLFLKKQEIWARTDLNEDEKMYLVAHLNPDTKVAEFHLDVMHEMTQIFEADLDKWSNTP